LTAEFVPSHLTIVFGDSNKHAVFGISLVFRGITVNATLR